MQCASGLAGRATAELILASTSPRRQKLLKQLGRPFRIIPPTADETLPYGLSPTQASEELAVRKAESVAKALRAGLVIGADTIVALGDRVIGKPTDCRHAIEILEQLCGQTQSVITGICLLDVETGRRRVASEVTQVTMRPTGRAEIEAYVDSGEGMGKAGAYAIQETGDRFVERVQGSLSNVVGLPLELLGRLLDEMESS